MFLEPMIHKSMKTVLKRKQIHVAANLAIKSNWSVQAIQPTLGFYCAEYTNPKYCMYTMSSCSSWLLHAVLDKTYTLTIVNLLFVTARHLTH